MLLASSCCYCFIPLVRQPSCLMMPQALLLLHPSHLLPLSFRCCCLPLAVPALVVAVPCCSYFYPNVVAAGVVRLVLLMLTTATFLLLLLPSSCSCFPLAAPALLPSSCSCPRLAVAASSSSGFLLMPLSSSCCYCLPFDLVTSRCCDYSCLLQRNLPVAASALRRCSCPPVARLMMLLISPTAALAMFLLLLLLLLFSYCGCCFPLDAADRFLLRILSCCCCPRLIAASSLMLLPFCYWFYLMLLLMPSDCVICDS